MIDRHHPTWIAVKAHAETEIEAARKRLELTGLDPAATEHERGRIAGLRKLLSHGEPPERIPASGPVTY
jgi:hypothetical protein